MSAKGYWIAHATVHDTETYDIYRQANSEPLAAFRGKFLGWGGVGIKKNPEGAWSLSTAVIEFPSYADVVACY